MVGLGYVAPGGAGEDLAAESLALQPPLRLAAAHNQSPLSERQQGTGTEGKQGGLGQGAGSFLADGRGAA